MIVDCAETLRIPWYDEVGRVLFATPKPVFSLTHGRNAFLAPPAPLAPCASRLLGRDPRTEAHVFGGRSSPRLLAPRRRTTRRTTGCEPMMMSVDDVRLLASSGIEVGCHSITHPILPLIHDQELDIEIAGGRRRWPEPASRNR